jgi:hypothetical protein
MGICDQLECTDLRDILSFEPQGQEDRMHKFRCDVDHKLRVLKLADKIGDVGKACRYFWRRSGSFYRWRTGYRQHGVAALENRKTAPKNPANRTAPEIVEKVLRKTYRLGPVRIVWYLARYHATALTDAVQASKDYGRPGRILVAAKEPSREKPDQLRTRI